MCIAFAVELRVVDIDVLGAVFDRKDVILRTDEKVATGAGHHSVIYNAKKNQHYIVYHRHPLGSKDGNNRVTCIDVLEFDDAGNILPVKMTFEGVKKAKL